MENRRDTPILVKQVLPGAFIERTYLLPTLDAYIVTPWKSVRNHGTSASKLKNHTEKVHSKRGRPSKQTGVKTGAKQENKMDVNTPPTVEKKNLTEKVHRKRGRPSKQTGPKTDAKQENEMEVDTAPSG